MQRVRKICDPDSDFETKSLEMMDRFQDRGNKKETVQKASLSNRDALLVRNPSKTTKERVIFTTKFTYEADKIKQIIKNNWSIIESDEALRQIFPDFPW